MITMSSRTQRGRKIVHGAYDQSAMTWCGRRFQPVNGWRLEETVEAHTEDVTCENCKRAMPYV